MKRSYTSCSFCDKKIFGIMNRDLTIRYCDDQEGKIRHGHSEGSNVDALHAWTPVIKYEDVAE